MPLLKRKADGNFEDWRASSSTAQPTSSPAAPPAKKAKLADPTTRPAGATASSSAAPGPGGGNDWFADVRNGYTTLPSTRPAYYPPPPPPRAALPPIPPRKAAPPPPQLCPSPPPSTSRARAAPTPKATPTKAKAAPTPKPKAKPKEKRQGRFKSSASQAVMQRLERVACQRFFMIDREREGDALKEVFSVLGSTGNVYKVTIDHLPRCDCPDFGKGNHCKHIIFIFTKVLQVSRHSTHWYQKALLTDELEEIFRDAPLAPNAVAHDRVREAHARATGKAPKTPSSSQPQPQPQKKRRMPTEEDDCPICYDNMHNVAETTLVWCEECGNALHNECFGQWQTTQRNASKTLTCVWCRANWIVVPAGGSGGGGKGPAARVSGGYLNLAQAAGLSPQRDTSSYYMGPRRGERYYGYQEYEDDD